MNNIQKAREMMKQELEKDEELRFGYQSNIAMLLYDRYGITDYNNRNLAANDILKLVFDMKEVGPAYGLRESEIEEIVIYDPIDNRFEILDL